MFMDDHPAMREKLAAANLTLTCLHEHWARMRLLDADYIETITSKEQASKNVFYLNLVAMLAPAFPLLTIADRRFAEQVSYDLYLFAMNIDAVIDERNVHALIAGIGHFQSACIQLGVRVGEEDPLLTKIRTSFSRSVLVAMEEQASSFPAPMSYDYYANVARRKCGLALIVPKLLARCCDVTIEDIAASRICDAFDHVHVGMQWMDDVEDFRADCLKRQPSLLHYRFVLWAEANGVDPAICDIEKQRRLMFISGLAELAFEESAEEFRLALDSLEELPLDDLKSLLLLKIEHSNLLQKQVKTLREAALEKVA